MMIPLKWAESFSRISGFQVLAFLYLYSQAEIALYSDEGREYKLMKIKTMADYKWQRNFPSVRAPPPTLL